MQVAALKKFHKEPRMAVVGFPPDELPDPAPPSGECGKGASNPRPEPAVRKQSRCGLSAGFLFCWHRECEAAVPTGQDIHAIADNWAARKHEATGEWLSERKRWVFHSAPTSCSWPDAVGGFFGKLTRRRLRRGVHKSIKQLEKAILDFIQLYKGKEAKQFNWTASPERLIAARQRRFQKIDSCPRPGRMDSRIRLRSLALALAGHFHYVIHQAGNSGLAQVLVPDPTPDETKIAKLGLKPRRRLNPALALCQFFHFLVKAPLDSYFERRVGNRFLLRNKETRNGFSRGQQACLSKFSIPSGIVIVLPDLELLQGSLQDCAVNSAAGFCFGGLVQRFTDNLKKIGVALRLVGRVIQNSGFDAEAHPLQGNLESLARCLSSEELNADFVQSIPK